jgi:peptidyl-prolyl cis-trans isomerase SurA
MVDADQSGKKKYKIVMVTNRINEHTADYGKDYLKIKDLALKEKQINAIAKC